MGKKISRVFAFMVALIMICSGIWMATIGDDYARGTYMLVGGFGLYLIAQIGAIYDIVSDTRAAGRNKHGKPATANSAN